MASHPNPSAHTHCVPLPVITERDDITYWRKLTDQSLRNTIGADLWNVAAGLAEQNRRDTAVTAALNAAIAQFSQARS